MRMAKRINRKTGQEEPLRTQEEILRDIRSRLHRRIRWGAPAVENDDMLLILEALELILQEADDDNGQNIERQG